MDGQVVCSNDGGTTRLGILGDGNLSWSSSILDKEPEFWER